MRFVFLPNWVGRLRLTVVLLLACGQLYAGSATWDLSPGNGVWNTASNWTPATVPNGASDTATFDLSFQTSVNTNADTTVAEIIFNSGASAFTITNNFNVGGSLTISGTGITNNSGLTQNFVNHVRTVLLPSGMPAAEVGFIIFNNSATAGSLTAFTNEGSTVINYFGAYEQFNNTSSAGSGLFTNNAGTVNGAYGGFVVFQGTSTADTGTFVNKGGTTSGALGGEVGFEDSSTAGSATITNIAGSVSGAGGGVTGFFNTSTAASATLLAGGGAGSGGSIRFFDSSTGGTARVEVFGNGNLDISSHTGSLTIGSVEGSGNVFLGAKNLTVGSNNNSTTFSGVIQDSGGITAGTGGSLTKTGTGTLTLSGANTYTGATTVNAGTLVVGFGGTGSLTSAITVNAGTLGGSGSTTGSVTIGNGAGSSDSFIAPGNSVGTFTTSSSLSIASDGVYKFELNSGTSTADKIVASGISLNSSSTITFTDLGSTALTLGTTFKILDNTSAGAITGTFSNLAEGQQVTIGLNTYQADYMGGDGNDLTLTVVANVVPEPSTWAMVVVGAGLLWGAQRLRWKLRS